MKIKQLKQNGQTFVPQTVSEAVLVKVGDEVLTLKHLLNFGNPEQVLVSTGGIPKWENQSSINAGKLGGLSVDELQLPAFAKFNIEDETITADTLQDSIKFTGTNIQISAQDKTINFAIPEMKDGVLGLVKGTNNTDLFLKGDGSWATPINTWRSIIVGNNQLRGDINTGSLSIEAGENTQVDLSDNTLTISSTDTEYSAGEGLLLEDNEFKNTGVLSVTTGDTEGTIKVNNTSVPVYGLKSAAYTESSEYAQKGHTHDYIQTISVSGFGDITAENNKVTLPEYPTELPNPHSLFIGGVEYDGSEEINITAEGIGAVTTLGTLSFSEGEFKGGEFNPTTDTTINIPKTTNHIVEGDNLYFTTDRVIGTMTGGISTIVTKNLTKDKVLISNSEGKVTVSNVTNNELSQLEGVRANIQQQLNEHTHKYAESETEGGSAISAQRLTTNKAGDTNSPVYFEEGIPKVCDSTLDVSITGNANTVGGYKIEIVEGTAGSNSKTIYFVI